MNETVELYKMAPKDMTRTETFCEKHGFVYHDTGRGRNDLNAYWTFCKVVDGGIVFSLEFIPVIHSAYDEIIISNSWGTYKGSVQDVDHLKLLLDAMHIDIEDIENKEQSKATAQYRFERKLKLASEVGQILDDVKGWRNGKGYDIVLQYSYLEIESLSELTRTDVRKIADQILTDYDIGRID